MNHDASSPPPAAAQALGPAPVEGGDCTNGRLVFDITTTALWTGPPFGIVRVEGEFARWGLGHMDAFTPAIFDPRARTFRHVGHDMARRLIAQDAAIDTLSLVNPARVGKRKTDRIPRALRPAALWVLQSRRKTLAALERIRIGTTDSRIAAFADRVQRVLMNAKHRAAIIKPDGSRRDTLPLDMVAGAAIDFTAPDTLICCGSTWTHADIAAIAEQKRKRGFRLVLFCHDIIPLMFPQFFKPGDVAAHVQFWHRAFPTADLVICNSRKVETDARAYCNANALVLGQTAVCTLGANFSAPAAGGATAQTLPAGLEPGHYALLVGTIEPRKGHRMIYEAWCRLLADGLPQRARFQMVFAGREGWMTGDLMAKLRGDARTGETLKVLTEVDDAVMATLYANAAFCLLPSRYEGFGLPAIEAFHHGKAVLASTGGAVPEAVGDLSPCLDPEDAEAWRRMLHSWIEDPAARAIYEERIRTSFRHPSWEQSSQAFFALASNRNVQTFS
jgi:glycosyltransferase involved in cell wall biosynthesis